MKASIVLFSLATALVACGSPEADPDPATLPDATPTPTPDADPPDAAPPAPTMARVRLTVRGSAIAGVPVVFHDADGNPVDVEITNADGAAEAAVGPGAMATIIDLRGVSPSLTTFVGVEPGDDLLVAAPELPVAAGMNATVVFAPLQAIGEYRISAGCASLPVTYANGVPLLDKQALVIPPDCLIEGGARFHVIARGAGITGLISAHAVAGDTGFGSVEMGAAVWQTSAGSTPIAISGAAPAGPVFVQGELLPSDGAAVAYDESPGTADETGAVTLSVRPGLGGFTHRVTAVTAPPAPPAMPALSLAIGLPAITKLLTVETTSPSAPAQVSADFTGVLGVIQSLGVDGADFPTAKLTFTATGDLSLMTGMRTTLVVRRADNTTYRWSFVHPSGAPLALPKLPDGQAALRPVTWIPASVVVERGTPFATYRDYRNVQGRPTSSAVVYRSSYTLRSPVPPALP